MAVISSLNILLTATSTVFDRKMTESAVKLRAYQNTVNSLKEGKLNLRASWTELQAGVIQAKRIIERLKQQPAVINLKLGAASAPGKIMAAASAAVGALAGSKFGQNAILGAERLADGIAVNLIRARRSVSTFATGAKNAFYDTSFGRRTVMAFENLQERIAFSLIRSKNWLKKSKGDFLDWSYEARYRAGQAASGMLKAFQGTRIGGAITKAIGGAGKLAGGFSFKNLIPFGGSDILKSLGPFARLARSGIRIPVALATQAFVSSIGPIKAGIGHFINGIAGIATVAAVASIAVFGLVKSTVALVDANYTAAASMGASTEGLRGLQIAAKQAVNMDPETFINALATMQRKIGETAVSGGAMQKTIDDLGLSLTSLSTMGADEQFLAISDALAKVPNVAQRSAMASDLFGAKVGQKLIPVLSQGREALKGIIDKQTEFGAALKTADAAKLVQVQNVMNDLDTRIEGVKNQFALAFGPAIAGVIEELLGMLPAADKMRAGFMTAVKAVGYGLAFLSEGWVMFKVRAFVAAIGVAKALGWIVDGLVAVIDAAGEATKALGGDGFSAPASLKNFGDGLQAFADQAEKDMFDAIRGRSAFAKVDDFLAAVEKKSNDTAKSMASNLPKAFPPMVEGAEQARQKIAETLDGLRDQVASFGLDAPAKALMDLGKNADRLQKQFDSVNLEIKAGKLDSETLKKKLAIADAIKVEIDFTLKGADEAKRLLDQLNQKEIGQALKGASDNVEKMRLGLSDKAFDLMKKGASAFQVTDLQASERMASDIEEARRVREDAMTAAEQLANRMSKLTGLRDRGLIDQDTFDKASEKARKELEGKDSTPQKLAFQERRSTEGLVNAQTHGAMKDLLNQSKEQTKATQKTAEETKGVREALEKNRLAVVSIENA